jgi:hypothetical protein
MTQKFTNEQIQMITDGLSRAFDANIAQAQSDTPREIQTLELDLSKARKRSDALKVSFPFTSLFIQEASSVDSKIRIIPNSNDDSQSDLTLQLKDNFSLPNGVSSAFLYWDEQPDTKMVLKFFVTAKFSSGQLILNQNSVVNEYKVGNLILQNDDLSIISRQKFVNQDGFVFGADKLNANNSFQDQFNKYSKLVQWEGTGLKIPCFVVPEGYDFYPLSAEFSVQKAWTASGFLNYIDIRSAKVEEGVDTNTTGTTYTGVLAGYKHSTDYMTVGRIISDLEFIDQENFTEFSGIKIPSGHAVWFSVSSSADGDGYGLVRFAGRLVPIVGS